MNHRRHHLTFRQRYRVWREHRLSARERLLLRPIQEQFDRAQIGETDLDVLEGWLVESPTEK